MGRPGGIVASDLASIKSIQRTSLTDEIMERLLGLIIDEGLNPGHKLPSERELMARLAVGRSTLREAIKSLRAIGVLHVVIGEGTFVGTGGTSIVTKPLAWGLLLTEDSALQVIEARRVIEVELAGLAATRATSDDLEAIGATLDWRTVQPATTSAYILRDLEFHLAIARAAHNDVLFHVIDILQHAVRSWMNQVYGEDEHGPRWLIPHQRVYTAISQRDPVAARREMVAHLEPTELDWLEALRESRGDRHPVGSTGRGSA
jgi:GntR family transcriptional repressor for pyruvate dehydrogenase complex